MIKVLSKRELVLFIFKLKIDQLKATIRAGLLYNQSTHSKVKYMFSVKELTLAFFHPPLCTLTTRKGKNMCPRHQEFQDYDKF